MLLAIVLAWLGAPPAKGPDLFDELFRKGQPQFAAFQTATARFTETTRTALLRDPLVAHGKLAAARPSKLRLDYDPPDVRTIIVDEQRMLIDWPSQHEHIVRDISRAQQRVQKYFVDKDPHELRSNFDIQASKDAHLPGTYVIEMTPRRKQIQEGLSKLEIWLDDQTWFMRQMRMTFPNGDTKLFALEDVRMNAPVDPKVFEVQ